MRLYFLSKKHFLQVDSWVLLLVHRCNRRWQCGSLGLSYSKNAMIASVLVNSRVVIVVISSMQGVATTKATAKSFRGEKY